MVLVTPAPLSSEEHVGPDGKTTKITSIESAASKKSGIGAERRLVEYFCVISSVPTKVEENFTDGNDKPDSTRNVNASAPIDWKVNIGFENEDDSDEFVGSYDIKPVITARYPIQDHRDNPLHENVTFFCHPSGGIRISMEPNMPKVCPLVKGFVSMVI